MDNHRTMPFQERHGAGVVELLNRHYPDHFATTLHQFRKRIPVLPRHPWVVADGDHVVGYAELRRIDDAPTPPVAEVGVWLSEELRHEARNELWSAVIDGIGSPPPVELYTVSSMDDWHAVRKLYTEQGLHEHFRSWGTWVELDQLDVEQRLTLAQERVANLGVDVRAFSDLAVDLTVDEATDRLTSLAEMAVRDIPRALSLDEPSASKQAAEWVVTAQKNSETCFVAVQGDRWLGIHMLVPMQQSGEMDVDITAIAPQFRKKGLATALKLHGMQWAKMHGVHVLRTGMADTNRPIVDLNEKLGFQREPAWTVFSGIISPSA